MVSRGLESVPVFSDCQRSWFQESRVLSLESRVLNVDFVGFVGFVGFVRVYKGFKWVEMNGGTRKEKEESWLVLYGMLNCYDVIIYSTCTK